jgi:hypothetical protein
MQNKNPSCVEHEGFFCIHNWHAAVFFLSVRAKKSPRKAVGGELYLSLTKQNYRK